jgi:hypothetical protein
LPTPEVRGFRGVPVNFDSIAVAQKSAYFAQAQNDGMRLGSAREYSVCFSSSSAMGFMALGYEYGERQHGWFRQERAATEIK